MPSPSPMKSCTMPIFERGQLGDWHWSKAVINAGRLAITGRCGYSSRTLRGEGQGPLKDRDLELISVFPMHAPNNWAEPGDVHGMGW